jgi:hypothetical protein
MLIEVHCMRLTRKFVIVSSLAVIVTLAVSFLALPPLVKHLAIQKISEATGRKAEIAKLSINPFTLSAGIAGFRLSEKGSGGTFLAFSSARLSLSPLSLPRRALIITELQVAAPYLHIVRMAPNRFNFSDLLTGKKPKKGGSLLFSLNNISVTNGSLDFQDKALRTEKSHRVTGLSLSVPFFSTIPYLADRYVAPNFSAVVNGSPLAFKGRLKPLTRSVEASIDLKVQQLDLPHYLGYLPFPLPVQVDSGRLTTSLVLGYRVDANSGPETTLAGSIALDRVALRQQSGAPLLALQRGELKIKNAALASRRIEVSSLDLDGLELTAARDAAGVWNFQKLGAPPRTKPPEARLQPAPVVPLALKLAKLSLSHGKVHLSDSTPKGGFRTDLNDIDLSLRSFSTAPGQRAPFTMKLATARSETASLKGELVAEPLEVRASLALAGIRLKEYYPYLSDTLTAPVSGTLGVSSEILYSRSRGLVLERTALKGENLAAPFGHGEGVHLKGLLASGIRVDLKQKNARVENLVLKGGNLVLSREVSGAISPERLLRPKPAPAAASFKAGGIGAAKGRRPAAPFTYRIDRFAGSGLGIRFTDRTRTAAPLFTLSRLKFSLAGIAGPKQGPIPFTLASGYGNKGRISATGTVNPAPLLIKGNLELHRIPLRDFDAYIPEETTVFLADGTLDTKLSLNLEKGASGVKGSFGGSLGVRSFYCQDTVLEEDLLKWDSLQMEKVSGTLGPLTLAIGNVSLSNFYTRVIVEKDGTLNLQHLMRAEGAPPAAPQPAAPGKPAPAAVAAGQAPGPQNAIRIDTVTMQGGTLALSDRHLKTVYDTTFYNLGGRVSGLSSQSNRAADVDLRGNLENHSPLSITGVINPLRGDLFLDLKIAFTDIDLSPLTPYSNTYLGYNVDKGKLSLDLAYRIDKKVLTSQNRLFIDQFTFGTQVESEKATKLPVRLAVALLKDRKGEIHLDLPVAGLTDDPKFNVWGVVVQMLKNLLVKAATSPFALLGSLLGGGEDFSAVPFAPGSTQLSKAEEEKLLKLSQALRDRPALNLEISGFVDREKDAEGYRKEMLVKKLKGEKFRALVKGGKSRGGETQEGTELLPQEYPVYLKAVYAKEKFPKPRNALGFIKQLPGAEMEKLIITHTVVSNNELQALARARAGAVRAFLQENGKLPAERLFEKNADIFRPSSREGTSGSRVEFGANVR